jgi:hypothetical protein
MVAPRIEVAFAPVPFSAADYNAWLASSAHQISFKGMGKRRGGAFLKAASGHPRCGGADMLCRSHDALALFPSLHGPALINPSEDQSCAISCLVHDVAGLSPISRTLSTGTPQSKTCVGLHLQLLDECEFLE